MAVTVAAVMRQVRNYFEREPMAGSFSITGNGLSPAPDAPFVAIRGSSYHDGVYELLGGYLNGVREGLPDETFEGCVFPLHPPDDFLMLCKDIAQYDEKNPVGAKMSESFGHYSYTRAGNGNGGALDWQSAYALQLVPYRRMFSGVF